jgi:uncharacterized protein YegL
MDDQKGTGIQISNKPNEQIAIVGGGIKILASGKPINASLAPDWGSIFILLDCSGSMKHKKLDQAKSGIMEFARDAFQKKYRVGLIRFGDNAEQLSEPTTDIAVLQEKIAGMRAGGSTNLTAALMSAHLKLKNFGGPRVIVIATDGMPDNIKSSLEAAESVKLDGIEIITIGTEDAKKDFLNKLASRSELSAQVSNDQFGQAISSASLLLTGPKSIKPI